MAPVGEAVGYEAAIGGHHHPLHPCRVELVLHQLIVRAVVLNNAYNQSCENPSDRKSHTWTPSINISFYPAFSVLADFFE